MGRVFAATIVFLATVITPGSTFLVVKRKVPSTTRLGSTIPESDLVRATYCSEHFGECPIDEMESLREKLHLDRLRSLAVGGGKAGISGDTSEILEEQALERELDLQLGLLRKESNKASLRSELFPDIDSDLLQLNAKHPNKKPSIVTGSKAFLLDETIIEPIFMCAALLAIIVGPQLLGEL